jgi:hypothetical protein
MTLFFAHDPDSPFDARVEDAPAARVLTDAVASFLGQVPRPAER